MGSQPCGRLAPCGTPQHRSFAIEGISDITIRELDASRPPRIRKEPYIDLHFRLSHQAPADWCKLFNDLLKKRGHTGIIKPEQGLFIDTWVRKPEEIQALLEQLKQAVKDCSERYIQQVEAAAAAARRGVADARNQGGEQGELNRIVDALDFDKG